MIHPHTPRDAKGIRKVGGKNRGIRRKGASSNAHCAPNLNDSLAYVELRRLLLPFATR